MAVCDTDSQWTHTYIGWMSQQMWKSIWQEEPGRSFYFFILVLTEIEIIEQTVILQFNYGSRLKWHIHEMIHTI